MKIAYLIEVKKGEELDKKTSLSLPKEATYLTKDENDYISSIKEIKDDFTHIIIIKNGSELNTEFLDILNTYYEENTILLPLVVMNHEKKSGVLNSCIWNSNLTGKLGVLDHELAIKQIDLSLYGALIPKEYFVEDNFNSDILYYQHFYFLNKVTYKDIDVIGIPKTLIYTNYDLSYDLVSVEEKIKYFNMAKEVYPVTEEKQ